MAINKLLAKVRKYHYFNGWRQESPYLIPQSLLKGHTAKEAHEKGKKAMYDQLINLMTDEDQTIDNSHIIATLWHDQPHQKTRLLQRVLNSI